LENFCKERNIFFNPYQVIERWLLTDIPTKWGMWSNEDMRSKKYEYQYEQYVTVRERVERMLVPLSKKYSLKIENMVTHWVAMQPQVKLPIVWVTKASQLKPLLTKFTNFDTSDLVSDLNSAYLSLQKHVQETYDLSIETYRWLV